MSQSDSLVKLLDGLQAHDNDAATALFERYAHRLIALARTRLSIPLRQKVDPEDIAQSVFKSFFRRQGCERFTFEDWGGVWGLLVLITMRKCGRRTELFQTAARNLQKEIRADSERQLEIPGGEATPDETASLTETIERIMARLDDRGRQIFSLKLQGYSVPEISDKVSRSQRTVHRILEQVKVYLSEELDLKSS